MILEFNKIKYKKAGDDSLYEGYQEVDSRYQVVRKYRDLDGNEIEYPIESWFVGYTAQEDFVSWMNEADAAFLVEITPPAVSEDPVVVVDEEPVEQPL